MLWYILLSFLSYLLVSWIYNSYHNVWKYIAKFPGPKALPIVGNFHQLGLRPEKHFTVLVSWMKEFNFEIIRLYGGPQPYILVTKPKTLEYILSSTTLLQKDDIYAFMRPWLGQGLLTSNGNHWAKHRKMITPSFHFQILQDFLHIINETTDRFMILLESFADRKDMFDFQKVVTRSTIDVICESAMGTRVNAIEHNKSHVLNAIKDMCGVIEERVFSVIKRSEILFYLSPTYQKQRKALKILRHEMSLIIESRREILKQLSDTKLTKDEFKRPKMAFLDTLLTAQVDGRPLNFQEIFDEVSTFMFEGHDTTASAITFAIYCLSRHPHIQKAAFDEQLQIYGADTMRQPTYQELQDMKYLDLVIKESLRLYPSVPFIGRTMTELTEIDGLLVPKGTTILLNIIGVGIDERNFKEPFVFKPERFEADKRIDAHPFAYVPFSAGPRNCIGQKFAMMELKVTISKILRHFHILPAVDGLPAGINDVTDKHAKPNNPYDPIFAAKVTLQSVNGVYIRLKRRVY